MFSCLPLLFSKLVLLVLLQHRFRGHRNIGHFFLFLDILFLFLDIFLNFGHFFPGILDNTDIRDILTVRPIISALASCRSLVHLDLTECSSLTDISALASCINLADVNLGHCPSLKDISALASCKSLVHLNLMYCSSLENISALAGCSKLGHVNLRHCNSLKDISVLSGRKGLHLDGRRRN